MFRSPQLRCDLSGLSVNVGESHITQSLKVRDLCVTFDQFINFDDHITAICKSTYFHIRNIGKIMNLLSYACSTIIHALISCQFIIVIPYCITFLRRKLIAWGSWRNRARRDPCRFTRHSQVHFNLQTMKMSDANSQDLCMAMTVISANIESLTARLNITGMTLIAERPYIKYGGAIIIRSDLKVKILSVWEQDNVELISIEMPGV